jgi:hypothetical protein
LVDHGANFDIKDSAGMTAVDVAKAKPGTLGNRSIYGGSVTDALLSVKDGKVVAPDVVIKDLVPPNDAYVQISRGQAARKGAPAGKAAETGRVAMLEIATGKPVPVADARNQRAIPVASEAEN